MEVVWAKLRLQSDKMISAFLSFFAFRMLMITLLLHWNICEWKSHMCFSQEMKLVNAHNQSRGTFLACWTWYVRAIIQNGTNGESTRTEVNNMRSVRQGPSYRCIFHNAKILFESLDEVCLAFSNHVNTMRGFKTTLIEITSIQE